MHAQLTTVTPLSKAVALALFVLLPVGAFAGGYRYGEAVERQRSGRELYSYLQNKTSPKADALVGRTQEYYEDNAVRKMYTNSTTGFSFRFDSAFALRDTRCSAVLTKSTTGSPRSPYIHLGIDGRKGTSGCLDYFNGQQEVYARLLTLKPGEQYSSRPIFTYERRPDIREGEIIWSVFVDKSTWEAPAGTSTYVYTTIMGGVRVWLMGTVTTSGQGQGEEITLGELESIRNSIAVEQRPVR